MTTTSLSKLLGSAALFLSIAIRSTASAETTECKQGFCLHVTETRTEKTAFKVVWFTGLPRAGDYLTAHYQIRGLPNEAEQIFAKVGNKFVVPQTSTISVQACRWTKNAFHPTVCTGWAVFKVEVSPPGAAWSGSKEDLERLQKLNALGGGPSAAKGTAKPVVPAPAPAPVPPAKPPKVVHHTGSDGSGSKSGAVGTSFVKGASIMAAPTTVNIPAGQSEGTTQIYWNAGEAHPYAEVWVKVGDEDEKRLLEKGKGSNAMKVRPGRNVFILTDAGEKLATVTVTGK